MVMSHRFHGAAFLVAVLVAGGLESRDAGRDGDTRRDGKKG
jgi:hypothetical protein